MCPRNVSRIHPPVIQSPASLWSNFETNTKAFRRTMFGGTMSGPLAEVTSMKRFGNVSLTQTNRCVLTETTEHIPQEKAPVARFLKKVNTVLDT